jgi:large subunit ribosomal protein L23
MQDVVIKKPVVTEKSLLLANTRNTYTFLVERTASKTQIKHSVEQLYGVKVEDVNTVMGHNSMKATGRRRLKVVRARVKKAMVRLAAGQTIALFDLTGETK